MHIDRGVHERLVLEKILNEEKECGFVPAKQLENVQNMLSNLNVWELLKNPEASQFSCHPIQKMVVAMERVRRTMHSHVTLALAVYVITVFSFVLVLLRAC